MSLTPVDSFRLPGSFEEGEFFTHMSILVFVEISVSNFIIFYIFWRVWNFRVKLTEDGLNCKISVKLYVCLDSRFFGFFWGIPNGTGYPEFLFFNSKSYRIGNVQNRI